jgi:hypothetical protein
MNDPILLLTWMEAGKAKQMNCGGNMWSLQIEHTVLLLQFKFDCFNDTLATRLLESYRKLHVSVEIRWNCNTTAKHVNLAC